MAHKKIRLDKKSRHALEQQLAAFRKKFEQERRAIPFDFALWKTMSKGFLYVG